MRDAQDADVLTEPTPEAARRPLRWSIPVALTVIALDQLTKRWALDNLLPGSCSQPDACIDLVLGARLRLVFNDGAAFSRGEGFGPVLGVLALVMAVVLLVLSTRRTDRFGIVAFGAVAGGAIGNLIDRFYRAEDGLLSGSVVDFVDLQWWPVFNVADSAIVVGVIAIIAHAFLVGEPVDDPEDHDGTGGDGQTIGTTGGGADPETPREFRSEPVDDETDASGLGATATTGDRSE